MCFCRKDSEPGSKPRYQYSSLTTMGAAKFNDFMRPMLEFISDPTREPVGLVKGHGDYWFPARFGLFEHGNVGCKVGDDGELDVRFVGEEIIDGRIVVSSMYPFTEDEVEFVRVDSKDADTQRAKRRRRDDDSDDDSDVELPDYEWDDLFQWFGDLCVTVSVEDGALKFDWDNTVHEVFTSVHGLIASAKYEDRAVELTYIGGGDELVYYHPDSPPGVGDAPRRHKANTHVDICTRTDDGSIQTPTVLPGMLCPDSWRSFGICRKFARALDAEVDRLRDAVMATATRTSSYDMPWLLALDKTMPVTIEKLGGFVRWGYEVVGLYDGTGDVWRREVVVAGTHETPLVIIPDKPVFDEYDKLECGHPVIWLTSDPKLRRELNDSGVVGRALL